MKIKIISGKGKWYEKLIGKIRVAKGIYGEEGTTKYDSYIVRNYRSILRTVAKEDAEIVNQ